MISALRNKGIKISSYLDDIFLCAQSPSELNNHVDITIQMLLDLGFHVNYEKSSLKPSQTLIHLGYILNSSKESL